MVVVGHLDIDQVPERFSPWASSVPAAVLTCENRCHVQPGLHAPARRSVFFRAADAIALIGIPSASATYLTPTDWEKRQLLAVVNHQPEGRGVRRYRILWASLVALCKKPLLGAVSTPTKMLV